MKEALDLNLILELKCGNTSALKKIYNIYGSKLFFFINSYTRNKEISEELVQDVFIKLWNNREKLETSKSITSFIYTIAKNHAIDYIRKYNVKIYSIDFINEIDYSQGNFGEEKLIYDEEEKFITDAINQLSPRKREVFELNRNEKLTYMQIARQLGISISAVEKNISSALKEIKNYISKKSS
jgi:RNA polymerase sigma-70 factor (ECF subfamily)